MSTGGSVVRGGTMMGIKKVVVVGSGTMGSGIAQVCAQAGMDVVLYDVSQEMLDKALKNITWSVGKLVEKGKLDEDQDTVLKRIQTCTNLEDGVDEQVELAIEAVFEDLKVKEEVFRKLDNLLVKNAIFASNTSAIPITALGAVTSRPDKVVGLHFFNPVPMMQAVEVVKGISTSDETMEQGVDFVKSLGKEAIVVKSDVPGFLLNRINLVSYVEAIRLVEQGIGNVEDIDKGVRLAFGRRMGPFETGDLVGLDVSYGALMAIYEETKDMRYYPPQLLRRKVTAGQLGRKSGRGWYEYNND